MQARRNIARARAFRKNANTPEQIAWEVFRTFRKNGYAVRRQHPIGKYVVDFAIVKEKLVIEIDGGIHELQAVALRDEQREKALNGEGWRILHIPSVTAMSRDHLYAILQKELSL